jgi:PIN domain
MIPDGKDTQVSKILLIDYENVQNVDLSQVARMDCLVCVFTGSAQNKIPIELVSSAQALGHRLSWIRIEGSGPNALDFHIAYYLGASIAKNPGNEYYVLSKDKGFDPLLKHIAKEKVVCKRISSISEIKGTVSPMERRQAKPLRAVKEPDSDYAKVIKNLIKIDKSRLPRSRRTLRQHVKTLVGAPQTEEKLDGIINQLFASRLIAEENNRLRYEI